MRRNECRMTDDHLAECRTGIVASAEREVVEAAKVVAESWSSIDKSPVDRDQKRVVLHRAELRLRAAVRKLNALEAK